jgi:hypothetical protein
MAYAPSGAYDRPLLSMSYIVSGNNLSGTDDTFIFVKCGNTENTVVPAAAGDIPMGVSYGTGKNGESIEVAMAGVVKLRLAGTVKRGNMLKVYTGISDGRAVASTNIAAYGAMALRDGASGNIIPAMLLQGNGS